MMVASKSCFGYINQNINFHLLRQNPPRVFQQFKDNYKIKLSEGNFCVLCIGNSQISNIRDNLSNSMDILSYFVFNL